MKQPRFPRDRFGRTIRKGDHIAFVRMMGKGPEIIEAHVESVEYMGALWPNPDDTSGEPTHQWRVLTTDGRYITRTHLIIKFTHAA